MVRILLITLFTAPLLSFSASAFSTTALRDSVGVARKNGKLFVQHRVEPKETLYALSRKYNVSVAQIVEANPTVENSINIGQVVLIPRRTPASLGAVASTAKTVPATRSTGTVTAGTAPTGSRTFTVNERGEKIHVVEPKQTLYSISRIYNVTVDEIRRWNGMSDNQVNVGAELIVGKGAPVATKKPIYVPEPDDSITKPAAETVATAAATPVEAAPVKAEQPAVAAVKERTEEEKEEERSSSVKKVVEVGLAEMIDPKADTNKYLALHKSAPVGTIMQVKNAMNGQVVYVRVIGKLPNTGANEKTIVRISKKAYQKLGAVDSRFRVELSYMP